MNDSTEPVTLAAFTDEIFAVMLVDALSEEGIDAEVAGGITGGFRAEAPGMVKVLVHAGDLKAATAFFTEWEHEGESIDWDEVDLGEPEDADE